MFDALRRVISEASGLEGEKQQQQQEQQADLQPFSASVVDDVVALSPPALVTENTTNMEEETDPNHSASAPLSMVHSTTAGVSDNCTESSSLSDGSVEKDNKNSRQNNKMTNSDAMYLEDDEDEDIVMGGPMTAAVRQSKSNDQADRGVLRTLGSGTTSKKATPNVIQAETIEAGNHRTGGRFPSQSQPPPNLYQHQSQLPAYPGAALQRMDSGSRAGDSSGSSGSYRASSQTSSRDWGWFEEIHVPDVGWLSAQLPSNSSSMKKPSHATGGGARSARGGGVGAGEFTTAASNLKDGHSDSDMITDEQDVQEIVRIPELDEETAAMAVTAPNYVLEESLSSQQLWKNTAGTRPPQPLEERQFYEKMWAQNFERSQVNYRMPVEVLAAATPVSLNPFADGVFEGATGTTGDMSEFTPTGNPHRPRTSSDGHEGDDVAEAALLSRMHQQQPNEETTASAAPTHKRVPGTKSDGDLTVLLRGENGFGTTVSKSFARSTGDGGAIVGVDTVNISIASYRVVESKKYGKYAQFLVIYREGSIRDTVGVWKRYRDFEQLSHKVTHTSEGCTAVIANMSPLAVTEEPEMEHLPNAVTSWRLLKKRKRWYRCLDAGYLSLKVFLLERFLHDILFESSSPKLLRDFVLGSQ